MFSTFIHLKITLKIEVKYVCQTTNTELDSQTFRADIVNLPTKITDVSSELITNYVTHHCFQMRYRVIAN